jgi:hypothetical protein
MRTVRPLLPGRRGLGRRPPGWVLAWELRQPLPAVDADDAHDPHAVTTDTGHRDSRAVGRPGHGAVAFADVGRAPGVDLDDADPRRLDPSRATKLNAIMRPSGDQDGLVPSTSGTSWPSGMITRISWHGGARQSSGSKTYAARLPSGAHRTSLAPEISSVSASMGPYTYESVMGGDITVPLLLVDENGMRLAQ